MPSESPSQKHPGVWMPLLALVVFMGIPLAWFAASLLIINPVFPLGVNYYEVQAISRDLQAHPQPTPGTIANVYYVAAGNSVGQNICIELNMISPVLHVKKDGFILSEHEASLVTSDQLGFPNKSPHPIVCFPSSYEGEMTHYRLEMAESFNPLSYHIYEWATKGN